MSRRQSPHEGSDRVYGHTERLGGTILRGHGWAAHNRRVAMFKRLGLLFPNEGLTCACGKPALRTWKGIGWCRACYERDRPTTAA